MPSLDQLRPGQTGRIEALESQLAVLMGRPSEVIVNLP